MQPDELIQELEGARHEVLAVIEDLPEGAFLEPGVMDDWTLKDILAHMSRWEGLCVTLLWKLKREQHAERLDIQGQEQIDDLNEQWHQQDKDRDLDLVLADYKGLRRQTLRRLEEFEAVQLTDPEAFDGLRGEPLWKWVAVDTFEHEREHLPAIRNWLANRD